VGSLNEIKTAIERLPSLPGSGAAILSALLSPEPDLAAVEKIVRQDEAMTAAVLKQCNSAAFGMPGREFDVGQGIRRLGRRVMMRIALEQQMTETLENAGLSYGLRRHDAWLGAVFGAIAAELLASELGTVDPGLAFTCTLLRDIGKLAVDMVVEPTELAELGMASSTSRNFLDLERERLGADHATIGAMIARRWNLPGQIAAAIEAHHSPAPTDDPDHSDLHDVVHAADAMCLWAGVATGHDGLRYPLAPHVQEHILKSARRVERVMADTWERFQDSVDVVWADEPAPEPEADPDAEGAEGAEGVEGAGTADGAGHAGPPESADEGHRPAADRRNVA
jgi:putative nucleotidyltransferase with HDIG domain